MFHIVCEETHDTGSSGHFEILHSSTFRSARHRPFQPASTLVGNSSALPVGIDLLVGTSSALPAGINLVVGTSSALPAGIDPWLALACQPASTSRSEHHRPLRPASTLRSEHHRPLRPASHRLLEPVSTPGSDNQLPAHAADNCYLVNPPVNTSLHSSSLWQPLRFSSYLLIRPCVLTCTGGFALPGLVLG
jgi:hypothetical protein